MAGVHDRACALLFIRARPRQAWAALALFVLYGSIGAPAGDAARAVALARHLAAGYRAERAALHSIRDARRAGRFGAIATSSNRAMRSRHRARLRLQQRDGAVADVLGVAHRFPARRDRQRRSAPAVGAIAADASGASLRRCAVDGVRSTGLLAAPARYVLAATLAAIVLAAWYPFDVTLDVSTLSDRTRAVRLDPWLRPGSARTVGDRARVSSCWPP